MSSPSASSAPYLAETLTAVGAALATLSPLQHGATATATNTVTVTPSAAAVVPALATPTVSAASATFAVVATAHLPAPPAACLTVLLDHAAYPLWNRLCPACILDDNESGSGGAKPALVDSTTSPPLLAVGSKFIFDVHLDLRPGPSGGRPQPLEVTTVQPVSRAAAAAAGVLAANSAATPSEDDDTAVGWVVAWKTRPAPLVPAWLLRSERVHVLLSAPPRAEVGLPAGTAAAAAGETTYATWDTFHGPLSHVVRLALGARLVVGFRAWCDDLVARVAVVASSPQTRGTEAD
ncbi:hypothetical protein HK405_004979 [Cladochytrium tenue]|nr:hypothetical protein HK405_004979 [Cladochytrium tenue]